MVLPRITADRVDFGDAGDGAHLRANDPVVEGAQIHRRPFGAVGFFRTCLGLDRVHEDLAETRGDRTHRRLDPGGKLRLHRLNALVHKLAGEVDVGAVLEHHRHLAQAIA